MFCDDNDPDAGRRIDGSPTSELLNTLPPRDHNGRHNDLCSVCSQNQLLKIKQLANFIPQNEV